MIRHPDFDVEITVGPTRIRDTFALHTKCLAVLDASGNLDSQLDFVADPSVATAVQAVPPGVDDTVAVTLRTPLVGLHASQWSLFDHFRPPLTVTLGTPSRVHIARLASAITRRTRPWAFEL